jgi:hypothetical protein
VLPGYPHWKRKLAGACWGGMCVHHPPRRQLQRFGIYLVVGLAVLLSQLYSL